MTTSLPGRPVSVADPVAPLPPAPPVPPAGRYVRESDVPPRPVLPRVLQDRESAQENLRNGWQLLTMVHRDESGVVHVAGPDYDAAMARLQKAIDQLEGRA